MKKNPENHPCMNCIHGYTYTMWEVLTGNVCKHPAACDKERLGRHFTDTDVPERCPERKDI